MTHPWGLNEEQRRRAVSNRDYRAEMSRCNGCGQKKHAASLDYDLCADCLKPKAWGHLFLGYRSVTVLRCPHGLFRAGATFTKFDLDEGLRAGTWPLGLVVRCDDEIRVVCGVGSAYRNPKEQLPRQWLRTLT